MGGFKGRREKVTRRWRLVQSRHIVFSFTVELINLLLFRASSTGGEEAAFPDANRVVEAVFLQLVSRFQSGVKRGGVVKRTRSILLCQY